ILASAQAPNEELFLLRRVAARLGATLAGISWSPPDAYHDDFLIKADKNPNTRGLALQGIAAGDAAAELLRAAAAGEAPGPLPPPRAAPAGGGGERRPPGPRPPAVSGRPRPRPPRGRPVRQRRAPDRDLRRDGRHVHQPRRSGAALPARRRAARRVAARLGG